MKYLKSLVILFVLTALTGPTIFGQIRPVYDRGVMGLGQALKRINTSATVMMIGAHPDDEDTALLAYLARGEAARTAYLSLTRGDGGQNILGGELGESLGVIRTEELLQARKLDGAEQYFTRAFDYGFSKTLDEAKSKWNEELVLCDAVQAIRDLRPMVVISRFSGTSADGHGQHQFAGYISPLAVNAAADPARCPAAGPAWNVRKFFISQGFRSSAEPRLRVNTGVYDPILGRSYFEVAMEARSQHRSQEQGVLELKGSMFSGMNPADGVNAAGIFAGIDTSVAAIAANTNNSESRFIELVGDLSVKAAEASKLFRRNDAELVRVLAEAYKLALDAESATRQPHSKAFMRQKQQEIVEAIELAAGIQIDAIADAETVIPGGGTNIAARVFYPASDLIMINEINLRTPSGWTVEKAEASSGTQSGFFRRESPNDAAYFSVTAPTSAVPTEPYWLRTRRDGDLFSPVETGTDMSRAISPPELTAEISAEIAGVSVMFKRPAEFRYADDTRGEIRRPLSVVPKLSVSVDRTVVILPLSPEKQRFYVSVDVIANSDTLVKGAAGLELPAGWSVVNAPNTAFELSKKGEKQTFKFEVEIPAGSNAGERTVRAFAEFDGERFTRAMETVAYPHIQTHRIYRETVARVNLFPIAVTDVKIGYLPGSGDAVAESMSQVGFDIATITNEEFAAGDLSRYDVIVVGIRASEVRTDFAANNPRLLEFARNGGTLVVQYQRPVYVQGGFTPFPAQMSARTADENAAVSFVRPEHPILNFPNKITAADFTGWIQERNLYNFTTMDERYLGILETHDPGETENVGGLVVADVGSGRYVYCSFSMFRQLPAGVPGAYRLFANILSLPRAPL